MTLRWSTLPLRMRLVALGVVGLLAGFAIGGCGLVWALHLTLRHSVDTAATATAQEIGESIAADGLPDPVPVDQDATVVQVFDADGRFESGSIGADPLVPLLRPDQLDSALAHGTHFTVDGSRASLAGKLRVTAIEADGHTVIVGVSQSELSAVPKFAFGLAITMGILAVGVGVALWWMVGWTLRPVEAARAKQRDFVADAAHELRSPLANMRTELEVAARIGPQEGLIDDLLTDVERLGRMTEDLLFLARMDGARRVWRPESVNAAEVIREIIADHRTARVRVVADLTDPTLELSADRDALHRILTNLTDNAVRHAETGVIIGARRNAGAIEFTVTDDGPGIPARDRARVFDRFTRLDDARARDSGGTGLGLAIVSELVAMHRGTITLSGNEPHGLKATVRLTS
ncbi:sensor histidine kinase [Stackebrandtia soli]|uniref:sensor histidine kinase n=1 Tax=Stackebrandtia soli TaxID=1892856 RepID=UPI0039EAA2AB